MSDPWLEMVRERMFEEGVIFVSGHLDEISVNRAAMELMTLDASGDSAVKLHLDCSGATLDAALALMDVIDAMGIDVHTTCLGEVNGPAIGIVAVSHRRIATPHTRFRFSEPRIDVRGHPRDIERAVDEHGVRLSSFCHRLATATRRPVEFVEEDLRSGRYLSAEEAKDYGLIDEVSGPEAKVIGFPRQLGFRRS